MDPATLILAGGAAVFLLLGRRPSRAPAAPAGSAAPPLGVPPPALGAAPAPASELHPSAEAGAIGKAVAGLAGVPVAGPLVAAVAQTELDAAGDIISGHFGAQDVATVAEFPVAVTLSAVNAVADLFGWSGKPLDPVQGVLLTAYTNPPAHDNVQPPNPVFLLDALGVLHEVVPAPGAPPGTDTINAAGLSWRAIVACDPIFVARLPKGAPISHVSQTTPSGRPADADGLRAGLGRDITFKLGASNDLHGPWEEGLTVWDPRGLTWGAAPPPPIDANAEAAKLGATVETLTAAQRARLAGF